MERLIETILNKPEGERYLFIETSEGRGVAELLDAEDGMVELHFFEFTYNEGGIRKDFYHTMEIRKLYDISYATYENVLWTMVA